jgi:uncharacterized protein (DUF488 family)
MEKHIWTIGHSTRTFEVFNDLLGSFEIDVVADIRNYPGSRRFPHFNSENLQLLLAEKGKGYIHFKALGGRRKPRADSPNTAWRHPAFRGYADYMETEDFLQAITQLEALALQRRTAYMCSEATWWNCHRSLVSDFLKWKGWTVTHIMAEEKGTEHPYTAPAKIADGKLSYSDDSLLFPL